MRFSTRPAVQAAYREAAGVGARAPDSVHDAGAEDVDAPGARRTQGAADAPPALVLVARPEPGPRAILSVPPRHEPAGAWTDDETSAPPQLPEGNEPEADPEATPGAESATVVESPPPRQQDILDWLAHGPEA